MHRTFSLYISFFYKLYSLVLIRSPWMAGAVTMKMAGTPWQFSNLLEDPSVAPSASMSNSMFMTLTCSLSFWWWLGFCLISSSSDVLGPANLKSRDSDLVNSAAFLLPGQIYEVKVLDIWSQLSFLFFSFFGMMRDQTAQALRSVCWGSIFAVSCKC